MTEAVHNGKICDSSNYLKENQLDALKSLAMLMLREVETLQSKPVNTEEMVSRSGINLLEMTQQYEADLIRAVLIKTGGNQRRAAKILGTKETTLNVKIKRYKISEANQHTGSGLGK